MAQGSDQEKTEKPTPKKLREAREKGQVAQSKEIPTALILLSALGTLIFAGSYMFGKLSAFMTGIFQNVVTLNLHSSSMQTFLSEVFMQVVIILTPLFLIVVVAGIAANLVQVGFLFTADPFVPKLSKLNPISGMKKFVSLKSLVELLKSIFKIIFVGYIAYLTIESEIESFPGLIHLGVADILSFIGGVAMKLCFFVCLALIVMAVADFTYQRWQHQKDLMMTKQQVKDETKQTEGDPTVKGRIRKAQMEMATRRMMEQVPDADVVITNPTHLAVALKFVAGEMHAPQVIAKGADLIAERIKKIAKEHDVPIVENKPLARAIFEAVEIGSAIPVELYRAVAEILAYVYRLKGMKKYKRS